MHKSYEKWNMDEEVWIMKYDTWNMMWNVIWSTECESGTPKLEL